MMWKADNGKRETRRKKEKDPTLGQIIFEEILFQKKNHQKIKNQKSKFLVREVSAYAAHPSTPFLDNHP